MNYTSYLKYFLHKFSQKKPGKFEDQAKKRGQGENFSPCGHTDPAPRSTFVCPQSKKWGRYMISYRNQGACFGIACVMFVCRDACQNRCAVGFYTVTGCLSDVWLWIVLHIGRYGWMCANASDVHLYPQRGNVGRVHQGLERHPFEWSWDAWMR